MPKLLSAVQTSEAGPLLQAHTWRALSRLAYKNPEVRSYLLHASVPKSIVVSCQVMTLSLSLDSRVQVSTSPLPSLRLRAPRRYASWGHDWIEASLHRGGFGLKFSGEPPKPTSDRDPNPDRKLTPSRRSWQSSMKRYLRSREVQGYGAGALVQLLGEDGIKTLDENVMGGSKRNIFDQVREGA